MLVQQVCLFITLIFPLCDLSGSSSQSELAIASSQNKSTTNCSYERSVKVSQNQNGSFMYGDLEIPPHLVQIYSYTISDNGTKIPSDNDYKRACVCELKQCLRICSNNLVKFYQNATDKNGIDSGFTKNITQSDGSQREMHLIHDFHHVVGRVCEREYSLDPERDSDMEWTLFENATLLRHYDNVYLSPDEYCFDIDVFTEANQTYFLVNPLNCAVNNLPWNLSLNAYAMIFSIPFFILTIAIYCYLPYLRNVYGKCFISYLASLATSYILISFLILTREEFSPVVCKVLGYIVYYTIVAYLTWTCVISYDTWKTLTHMAVQSSFRKYSLVGWSVPALMTCLTYVAQISELDEDLKPGINEGNCGVNTTRWSACLYFYVPCILVLIYSLVLYARVLRYIVRNKRNISCYRDDIKKSQKQRFLIYFRLFIFMGVSWIFDILSYFLRMTVSEKKAFFSIPDFFNASQGAFIFLIFICRKQVWSRVREKVMGRGTAEHRMITRSSTMEMK